ncbi:NAD-dependent epimerase/dehydratase family protein [Williamsia herbipolensis]|uniref:NAD-dependent epimerase/dehydratase family protein n=1 Tax=Williamsia herbipolensis TaxID=1603258 RepID=UPI0005F869FC|nr:NAD-dependent epimerase/dehydratase family protein [Williamsia herbipolensis]
MELLVLGGTGFLGRALAARAQHRGHDVTCLARGTRPPHPGVRFVGADRDRDDGLSAVSNRMWDAVIDLISQPVHARRAVRDVRARHRNYVSSSSVYAQSNVPDRSESAPIHRPLASGMITSLDDYGAAKAACEQIYADAGESSTIVRPALIGGFGDQSGRSGYYPWRFANPTGADVLVPDGTFPTALVDVDDLSEWLLLCASRSDRGIFNVAGRTTDLAEVFATCRVIVGSPARVRSVADDALLAQGVAPWAGKRSLPLWVPDPDMRFVATLNFDLARSRGFESRPLRETLAAALRYEHQRAGARPAGLTDDEEIELRALLDAA